ncbi:MAG TPA: TrkH family potassium uptake protein [Gammaproteobacteria bacterium]
MLFSTTLIPPLAVSLYYSDGEATHFSITFAIAAIVGVALWLPLHRHPTTIRTRDGFAIVAFMWTAISVLGSVPFLLALDISFADAMFESVSGYTTTGATVLVGLDELPRSMLLYRQELQWLGGIGVIVLSVALLPMLGIGGMQLYRAEVPGPFKDERMTPRVARTARRLSELYLGFTVACALCYWLAGMDLFDAIGHGMATVATGGYSTHDASIAYYDSLLIEAIAIVFMMIGGINFSVHFLAWRALRLRLYGQDTQTRAFVLIVAALSLFVAAVLYVTGTYDSVLEALRYGTFQVVSVITTTGFATANIAIWPLALPVLLIFSSFIGGSAGSTSGGLKVIRVVILVKQAGVHLQRLIHPRSLYPVRIDGRIVSDSIIDGIWGFFTVYVAVFALLMVVLMLDGVDQVTAFGAVSTSLNNLGPGLGDVAITFQTLSDHSTLLMAFSMLLGRLEIFTFLVLLTPAFWRR